MNCIIESITTKSESELGQKLIEITGSTTEALKLYSSFTTPGFMENFGNWEEDYINNTFDAKTSPDAKFPRTNSMGEPQLYKYEPKNPTSNAYYYIDKYGNKQPVEINGLNTFFTNNELKALASSFVAYSYNKSKFNLEDFNKELSKLDSNINSFLGENEKRLVLEHTLLANIINHNVNEGNSTITDRHKLAQREKSIDKFDLIDDNRKGFKRVIIEYLNTMDISVRDITKSKKDEAEREQEVIEGIENEGKGFEVAAYERSSKDSVGKDLKMELRFIKSSEHTDVFGNPTFIPFDDLWSDLINLLHDPYRGMEDGNVVDVFQNMYNKVSNLAKIKPDLNNLLLKMKDYTKIQKARFTYLGTSRMNHNLTTFSGSAGNLVFDVKNISAAFSGRITLINEWGNKVSSNFYNKQEGTLYKHKLKTFIKKFDKFIDRYNEQLNNPKVKTDFNSLKVEFNNLLNELGIEVNDTILALYLDGFTLSEGVLSNDEKSVLNRLSGAVNSVSYFLETMQNTPTLIKGEEATNIVENSQSLFNDLASLGALLKGNLAGDAIQAGGKSYYTFTLPSYLSQSINIYKNSRETLRDMRDSDPYATNSVDIQYLLAENEDLGTVQQELESERRLRNITLFYFNSFKEDETGTTSVDNAEISYTDSFTDYINKELAPMKGGRAIHRTLTPADKKTSMEYILGRFRETNAELGTKDDAPFVSVNTNIENIFIGYIADEYARAKEAYAAILEYKKAPIGEKAKLFKNFKVYKHLKQVKQEDESLKWVLQDNEGNYVGNAFKMFTFPSLSGIETELNENAGLWNDDNSPTNVSLEDADDNFKSLTETQVKEVRKIVQKAISDRIISNHKTALSENVLTIAEKDDTKKGITKGQIINNTIDKVVWSNYLHNNNPDITALGDFTINGLIANIEYSKIFQGDPSYYKSVPDYMKRATGPYTTGMYPRIDPKPRMVKGINKSQFFNIAVIDSIVGKSNYSEELTTLLGNNAYEDTNVADAQAWISPDRWKFLMTQTKDWNENYIKVYEKLKGTNNRPLTKSQQKVAAQPLKGVYFDKNPSGEPTLLKYSQFVIHDKLAVDNGLEVIYNKMIANDIDEVLTFDAIKVGAGMPSHITDNNLKMVEGFKLTPITLDNRWWKIQQDLTPKGIKENSLLSSQLIKNIFNSLDNAGIDDVFNWQGQELSAPQMIGVMEDLISRLSDIGATELKTEWGIGEDGVITNENSFYKSLIDEYKSSKQYDINVIKALENHSSPLAVIQAYPKMMSIMLSMIDKRTIKLTTPGGGFIQTSNFGIDDLTSLEQNGIVWFNRMGRKGLRPPMPKMFENQAAEEGKGTLFKTTNGVKYALSKKGKLIITPGQVLLSADKFRELFPGMDMREAKDLIDKDVLQILGYRIPNQATASSTPVEIVGILPEGLGDTVVAYSEITKQSGSDFDIDKLYLMMNAIKQDNVTKRVSIVKPKRKTKKETVTTTKTFKLKDIKKPTLEVEFLSDLELVETSSPVATKNKQDVLKEEYDELQKLINCLWA